MKLPKKTIWKKEEIIGDLDINSLPESFKPADSRMCEILVG